MRAFAYLAILATAEALKIRQPNQPGMKKDEPQKLTSDIPQAYDHGDLIDTFYEQDDYYRGW
jgi:hypothetical protein